MSVETILVVDDEAKVRLLLRRCLEGDGFNVIEAENEAGLFDAIKANDVKLVTLDIQLGKENGFEIAKRLRQTSSVPIMMVTGRDDVIDRVVGLEVGADDYLTKPFHVREVIARVRSILRRTNSTDQPEIKAADAPKAQSETPITAQSITFDEMTVHLDSHELWGRDGQLVEMTAGDFRLLAIFVHNPKKILSRDRIMDLLNGGEWSPLDRTIDNHVGRLRKKLERDPGSPVLIKTVRGLGYMLATDAKPVD